MLLEQFKYLYRFQGTPNLSPRAYALVWAKAYTNPELDIQIWPEHINELGFEYVLGY